MKKAKFLEFIVLSGLLIGAVVISLMNQTSALLKLIIIINIAMLFLDLKIRKIRKVRTFLLIR